MIQEIAFDQTIDTWCLACEAGDHNAMMGTLAPEFVLRSPITELICFEGIAQADDLFSRVFRIIEDFRVFDRVGSGSAKQVLFWRRRVGAYLLEEANFVKLNAHAQIAEMTIFMRPLPGLIQFASRVGPSLASRKGRLRALGAQLPLAAIAAMYCSGEASVIALTGAGTKQHRAAE